MTVRFAIGLGTHNKRETAISMWLGMAYDFVENSKFMLNKSSATPYPYHLIICLVQEMVAQEVRMLTLFCVFCAT